MHPRCHRKTNTRDLFRWENTSKILKSNHQTSLASVPSATFTNLWNLSRTPWLLQHPSPCAHLVTQNTQRSHQESPNLALTSDVHPRHRGPDQGGIWTPHTQADHPLRALYFLSLPQNQRVSPQAIWSGWICGLHWSLVCLEETPEAQKAITQELLGRVLPDPWKDIPPP